MLSITQILTPTILLDYLKEISVFRCDTIKIESPRVRVRECVYFEQRVWRLYLHPEYPPTPGNQSVSTTNRDSQNDMKRSTFTVFKAQKPGHFVRSVTRAESGHFNDGKATNGSSCHA